MRTDRQSRGRLSQVSACGGCGLSVTLTFAEMTRFENGFRKEGSFVPLGVDSDPIEKRMRLRYAGSCRVCGIALSAGTTAIWDRTTGTVRCVNHEPSAAGEQPFADAVQAGTAGASARREFERRKVKRAERTRASHRKLGGFILAVTDEKQSTRAWNTGALGEEKVGRQLNQLTSGTIRLLHDRRIPGGRTNIDHLAVTPSGVYVIDAKKYRGRPRHKIEGGLIRARVERLLVGTRDCTKLVDGVLKQVDAVRGLLRDEIPVHGVLCFVDADWPLIGGAFSVRGVQVLWPNKLYPRLQSEGPIAVDALAEIHRKLAHALPGAETGNA